VKLRFPILTLVFFSGLMGPAQACSYSRVSAALPVFVTLLPVLLFALIACRLRRRTSKRARISAKIFMLLTALAFGFFLYITWANTLGWESPCEGWVELAIQP
jgi:glucan phosphoethanolaminetransferase (alkaline phosphatase superfamily)